MSQALTSSGVAARPTPYFGDSANVAPARVRARRSALRIAHTSIRGNFPGGDAVCVVVGIGAAGLDQRLSRGLDVAGFIGAARFEAGLLSVPFPRQPESREGHSETRLVDPGVLPALAAVGRNLDALDPS